MTATNQYNNLPHKGAWALVALGLVLTATLLGKVHGIPVLFPEVQTDNEQNIYNWIQPSSCDGCNWSIIRNCSGTARTSDGSLSKKYRLAGTYIEYGGNDDQRKAILDDLTSGRQRIVSESEIIEDVQICRIFTDHIVIKGALGEEQLWLSFSNYGEKKGSVVDKEQGEDDGTFDGRRNRFGMQIGEHSWVFERQALLDYYNELMNEPQRLVAVFDSLKPVYDSNNKITGYNLDVEGESDFFEAVGLKPGDEIKAVNSMLMTNRRRAEYFIHEFVANRANAFLFDIERDGQKEKLVYRIR